MKIYENDIIKKIIKIKIDSSQMNKSIATYLLNLIKGGKQVPKITQISKELFISPATISRFTKKVGANNFALLRYTLNERNTNYKIEKQNNWNSKITKAANLIKNAKKVYFWGISGSKLINEDLNRKLMRMGINTIFIDNIEDQVGLSRLSNKDDVIFITSFSWKHSIYLKEITKIKARKILITSNNDKEGLISDSDIALLIDTKYGDDPLRIVTNSQRIEALNIIDLIIWELLKNDEFMLNNKRSIY